MKITTRIHEFFHFLKQLVEVNDNSPRYKVVEIYKDDEDYKVILQVVNRNTTFPAKPEEILANDTLVDCLSSRDVRTLTYLGYLSLNQPKYKILAQQFFENSSVFIVKKKGDKQPMIKTAEELAQMPDIVAEFNSSDANTNGYAVASREFQEELIETQKLHKSLLR